MTVAVCCVKSVPLGGRFLRIDQDRLTRSQVPHGLDPINEVAVEWAIRTRDAGALERVVALTMGPEEAHDAPRRALAMGADEAVMITDDALRGAGIRTTAEVLAAAARHLGAGLCLFGNESLDGSSGAVPAAVATFLGRPLVSLARRAEVGGGVIRVERDMGGGPEVAEAELPAVVSFVAGGVEPRYPKLKEIFAARKIPLGRLGLADLGLHPPAPSGERVVRLERVKNAAHRETRVVGKEVAVDEIVRVLFSVGAVDA